jgi:Papain fold toxin 2
LANSPALAQQITAIASRYQLFECVECALAIREFLIRQNYSGKQVSLFTGTTEKPFCNIYHDGLGQNISLNGRHEAIAVEIEGQERVFDNIHPQGISRLNWINNFYSPIQDLGQDFRVTEAEF